MCSLYLVTANTQRYVFIITTYHLDPHSDVFVADQRGNVEENQHPRAVHVPVIEQAAKEPLQ